MPLWIILWFLPDLQSTKIACPSYPIHVESGSPKPPMETVPTVSGGLGKTTQFWGSRRIPMAFHVWDTPPWCGSAPGPADQAQSGAEVLRGLYFDPFLHQWCLGLAQWDMAEWCLTGAMMGHDGPWQIWKFRICWNLLFGLGRVDVLCVVCSFVFLIFGSIRISSIIT